MRFSPALLLAMLLLPLAGPASAGAPAACAAPLPATEFLVNVTEDALDLDGVLPCDVGGPGIERTPANPDDPLECPCSLRAAVQLAHLTAVRAIRLDLNPAIRGPVATYTLSLTGAEDPAAPELTGDLDVRVSLSVLGDGTSGFDRTLIDAKGIKDRVFDVHLGATLELRRVTLLNGRTPKGDADPGFPGQVSGGCLRIAGTLPAQGMTLNLGSVFFYRCRSSGPGGALSLLGGEARMTDTVFSTNRAKGEGGGLWVAPDAQAETTRVTFARNRAGIGGAIASHGALTVRNSTVDRNRAKIGGGLALIGDGDTTLDHTTVSENGKVNLDASQAGGAVTLTSSIVWSKKASDCAGSVASGGGNLEGGSSCGFTEASDQQGQDPLLLPINDYGGIVPTRALGTTDSPGGPVPSPAVDRGLEDGGFCNGDSRDGRNRLRAVRSVGGPAAPDVGAFEYGGALSAETIPITSVPPDTATVGEPYTYDVESPGVLGREPCPLQFGLQAHPAGVSIDPATGVVSWTPAPGQEGSRQITVSVQDGFLMGTQTFGVTVVAAP